jgi:cytochrome c peroxidase
MRRLAVACAALFVFSACPESKPAAPPVPKKPEVVDAGPPPPPPKVELPAPKALPTDASKKLAAVEASESNPVTPEKAELGWMLFFDKRLSKDGSKACADCHLPDKAYTTGNAVDEKVGGAKNHRNSPTMVNIAYQSSWYWDGRADSLEKVSAAAWKGQLGANPGEVAMRIGAVPVYKAMFQRAFNERPTEDNVPQALASFFRTLQSTESAFDKFERGEKKAISADAQKGWDLFKKRGCVNCHVGPAFSDYDFHKVMATPAYQPTEDGGTPPGIDLGRKDATKAEEDSGKFKTPGLRSVALTAPYFHDGSAATLEDAIEKMAVGDPKAKGLDPKLKLSKLSAKEKAQLKAFLESLTSAPTWPAAPEKLPE